MSKNALPLPPDNISKRVGSTLGEAFDEQGRGIKECIVRSLPENYDFANKRILDFGCGSGRVLRHFQAEAQKAEFWACDIDFPSITWLSENFPAWFRVFHNTEVPHLPIESDYFDLIYVISVFTHITTTWQPWLLELRRVLKPGGILLVTFSNRIAYEYNTGQRFDEQNTGMLVMDEDRDWDEGGPGVFQSNWWVKKHWGQFFDIEYISREGLSNWQSLAVLIKRSDALKAEKNLTCPMLQPYLYQFYNPNFLGDLHFTFRRSNYLRYLHGLEMRIGESGEGTVSGWFASKAGRITNIKFVIDGSEVVELPGANRDREDVKVAYPDWPDSLHTGFEASLKLVGYDPGEHDLKVMATDCTGQQHEIQVPLILSDDKGNEHEAIRS